LMISNNGSISSQSSSRTPLMDLIKEVAPKKVMLPTYKKNFISSIKIEILKPNDKKISNGRRIMVPNTSLQKVEPNNFIDNFVELDSPQISIFPDEGKIMLIR